MPALTVIVAPEGPLAGVRDVLGDLSALGLLEPFLWCDAEDVADADARAVRVEGGRGRATSLRHALMAADLDRVRLCILVPVLDGAEPMAAAVEERVAGLVQAAAARGRIERLRCLVARPGARADRDALARDGWHNLFVAPEESPGPERGHALLAPSTDPVEIGRHAGPVVAAVLGLWSSVDDAPLDDQAVLPGQTVRQVRSYFRDLSAAEVETDLRERVASVRDELPRASRQGQRAVYVEDVQLATRTMARALWAKHEAVLQGPRDRPVTGPPGHVGPLAAVRMLFGYLGAALRNAPGRWYATVLNRTASGIAARMQTYVFGAAPSAYEVVIKGMTPSGLPASWQDEVDAAGRLEEALASQAQDRGHEATAHLGGLWRDYATAALTLADAGQRDPTFPPVLVGSAPGVLHRPQDCVPSAEHDFTDFSGYLAATVEIDRVGAADVLGARTLQRRLEHLTADDATALDAERALSALHAWQAERGQSFAVQVGGVLARRIVEVGTEVREHLRTIDALATAQRADGATQAHQRRLARWIRAILLVALLLVTAVVALAIGGVIAVVLGIAVAAGVVVGWFVTTLLVFLRQQRELFQELNRRRAAVTQMEATQANLRHALRDQRRLGSAYRQFLAWSAILGGVLSEPYGRPAAVPGARDTSPVLGLPVSCQLGSAVPDEAAVVAVAANVRRTAFRTGWLTEPFEACRRAAADRLGPEADDLRHDPELLFRLPAWPEPTLLSLWRDDIAANGVGETSGVELWSRVIADLEGPAEGLRARLVANVRPLDGTHVIGAADFMADVASPSAAAGHRFDHSHLTREAQAAGIGEVEIRHARAVRRSLGTTAVLTDISFGFPAYYLAAAGAEPEEGPRPDNDEDVF